MHVLPSLALGGAERFTADLASLQREDGYDAEILSLGSDDDFLVPKIKDLGIPIHIIGPEHTRLQRYRLIYTLARQFDVLHIHSPRGLRYISPLVPLWKGKTIVYTRHGLEPLDTLKWRVVHAVTIPFIKHITFVTQFAFDVFAQSYRNCSDKMRVITNGAYVPDEFNKTPSEVLRFGSVGRMVTLKGQTILLEAISILTELSEEVAQQAIQLKFFGAGPIEKDLRKQASKLPQGIVEFCGEVDDIELIYKNIDVLVVASQSEGLSMVIIEAMARKIPAIATEVGGNPTLVRPGDTGALVPYGDPQLLAETMLEFLENEHIIGEYGNAARRLIQDQFSLTKTHQAYLECYRNIPKSN